MPVPTLTSTDHPDAVAFWMYALIVPVPAVPAIWTWIRRAGTTFRLLFLGLLTMLSQYSMARAFRAADTSVVLPAHWLQVPLAAGWRFDLAGAIWVAERGHHCGSAYYSACASANGRT